MRHSLESSVFRATWWVVGESAGVRSWRHSCTTAPDAPHVWGKALTKPGRGTAVDGQPGLPGPAEASYTKPVFAKGKVVIYSNFPS